VTVSSNMSQVPHYSMADAMRQADTIYREDHLTAPGWESVEFPDTYEGVNYLFTKFFCDTPDKTEVFVTKCSVTAKGDKTALFNTYWTGQSQWDFGSVAKIEVLQQRGAQSQVQYLQHKVLSAAAQKKDVVLERQFCDSGNSVTAYAVSVTHPSRPEKYQQHARSFVVFHSFTIQEKSPGICELTSVWCYDFNGWVHQKFVDAEKTKVALRLTKIVKGTSGASLVPNYKPQTRAGTGTAGRAASNTYAEYNAAIRDANNAAPVPEPAYVVSPRQNLPPPFKAQPAAQHVAQPVQAQASSGAKFCSSCGTKAQGGNFCAGCGARL